MHIYIVGFSGKSARAFFEPLKDNGIDMLVDIRLKTQFTGDAFTNKNDLEYFLDKICNIRYEHDLMLAPTESQYEAFEKGEKPQPSNLAAYRRLLEGRQAIGVLLSRYTKYSKVCFMIEKSCNHSYVDVLLEMITERKPDTKVTRL